MTKTDTRRMVAAAAAACEEKKAEQIRILELDPADSGFTDFFLICSGTNERQNQAISTAIEVAMQRDFNTRPNAVEGYRVGEWILLDYVDFVVHIFSTEKRDFYDIERLRKTATSIDLAELKASLVKRVTSVRKKAAAKKSSARVSGVTKSAAKKPADKRPAKKQTSAKSTIGTITHPVRKGRATPEGTKGVSITARKKSPRKTPKKGPSK